MWQLHSCSTGETQSSHHIRRVRSNSQQQTCSSKLLEPSISSEWYMAVQFSFIFAPLPIIGKMQRLHSELPNAILRQVPDSGHLPHVDKPKAVVKLIEDFIRNNRWPGRCSLLFHPCGVVYDYEEKQCPFFDNWHVLNIISSPRRRKMLKDGYFATCPLSQSHLRKFIRFLFFLFFGVESHHLLAQRKSKKSSSSDCNCPD